MKTLLNIYNKALPGELLGTVSSYEEFIYVNFNPRRYPQAFTYTEYIERVKENVKKGYYFEKCEN